MARKTAWQARNEATKILNSTEFQQLVSLIDEGETKCRVKLVQDTAVKTASRTFKHLGFDCDYKIKEEWK